VTGRTGPGWSTTTTTTRGGTGLRTMFITSPMTIAAAGASQPRSSADRASPSTSRPQPRRARSRPGAGADAPGLVPRDGSNGSGDRKVTPQRADGHRRSGTVRRPLHGLRGDVRPRDRAVARRRRRTARWTTGTSGSTLDRPRRGHDHRGHRAAWPAFPPTAGRASTGTTDDRGPPWSAMTARSARLRLEHGWPQHLRSAPTGSPPADRTLSVATAGTTASPSPVTTAGSTSTVRSSSASGSSRGSTTYNVDVSHCRQPHPGMDYFERRIRRASCLAARRQRLRVSVPAGRWKGEYWNNRI
jgi:hypothetical protein